MTSAIAPAPVSPPVATSLRRAADFLKLAAQPARARILIELGDGERDAGQLLEATGLRGLTSLHPHVRILRVSGLIETRTEGIRALFSLTDQGRAPLAVIERLSRA